jgi:hypothetical protein
MGFPEHQIRLSKGVIAKFVQWKELATLADSWPHAETQKATVAVAFGNLV